MASPKAESSQRGAQLVVTAFDNLLVGIDAAVVQGILDAEEHVPDDSSPKRIDVPHLMGVDSGRCARRCLRINAGGRVLEVVVGATVRLAWVEQSAFLELPPFLSGLWQRLPFRGLFMMDEQLGYLIDPTAISTFGDGLTQGPEPGVQNGAR